MDNDKKLELLAAFSKGIAENSPLHMWFAIPGGMIMGRATTPEDYVKHQFGEDIKIDPELPPLRKEMTGQNRFIFLKDVTIRQGNNETYFNVAIVDGLDVSAWGFFDPK